MTNSVRGVVTREIDGNTHSFRLGTNEWCELEDDLGKSTAAIVRDLEAMAKTNEIDQRLFRSIFRAAMTYGNPEATARDAGDLMQAMGVQEAGMLVVEVVQLGMPQVKAVPKPGSKGTPGKSRRAPGRR